MQQNAAGNTELAASLQAAISSLGNVSGVEAVNVDAPAYTPVQGIDGIMLPTFECRFGRYGSEGREH